MKRSFHSVDIPSIASFDQHAGDREMSSTLNKVVHFLPMKRQRAVSADSSFTTTCRWCGGEDDQRTSIKIPPVDAVSSDDHLESPATVMSSQVLVAVVTPASTSNLTVDDVLDRRPCLPSLSKRRDKSKSDAFPATAALERFMLQRRGINQPVLLDDQDSGDSERQSDGQAFQSSSWQNLDREHELSSPRHVRDFRSEEDASIRSSFAGFSCSPPSSPSHHEPPTVLWRKIVCPESELECCATASPSLEIHPTKSVSFKSRINLNQLSEALARL